MVDEPSAGDSNNIALSVIALKKIYTYHICCLG